MEKRKIAEIRTKLLFNLQDYEMINIIVKISDEYGLKIIHEDGINIIVDPLVYNNIESELEKLDQFVQDPDYLKEYSNSKVPFHNGSYIYYLLDNGTVVYVGQTINVAARASSHVRDKKFTDMYYFEVPTKDRLMIESYNIIKHDPIYNGVGIDHSILFKAILRKAIER